MRLPEVCIRHPVLASELSFVMILLGLIAFQNLEIRYFPEYNTYTATVDAQIEGASADFMSINVADKLISAATGIDKVEIMSTNCTEGECTLNIKFDDSISNIQYINLMNKLRNSIEAIKDFPSSMENKPKVTDNVSEKGQVSNIITFVNEGGQTKQAMYDYISQQLVPKFKHIQGVGSVWGPYGGSNKAVRVWLNPKRMKELNIGTGDVAKTLDSYNMVFTSGAIIGKARSFSINPLSQVEGVEDIKDLVIRVDGGKTVRISDVANVEIGDASLTPSMLTINGKQSMSLQVLPLRSANPVNVASNIKTAMLQMQHNLPQGLKMAMVYNQADFIKSSIDSGFSALLEAIILVSLVVVLFLGSLWAASIPIITIPVCVIGVFAVMSVLGFSINLLTILAIILAIGLVVDDAIVVVENCYRYIESGETPFNAAIKGCGEIVFPIIAMTLTLAAVYLPIGLMSGLTADLFRQFSFTLASAVIISGMVALTLSPMMSAYLIRGVEVRPRWFVKVDQALTFLNDLYVTELQKWFQRQRLMLAIAVVLMTLAGIIYWAMPKILLPLEDSGFIVAKSKGPTGVGRRYHITYNDEINNVIEHNPNVGTNLSYIEDLPTNHILLKPEKERSQSIDDVILDLTHAAKKNVPAYDISFSIRSADDLNVVDNVQLEITSLLHDRTNLEVTAAKIEKLLDDYPGVANVSNSEVKDLLRFNLSIDRNAVVLSGVTYSDVVNALSIFLGAKKVANLHAGDGYVYPILVQLNRKDLSDFNVLNRLYVTSASGQSLPLSQFVTIKQATTTSSIKTFMGMNSAEITADLMPGYTSGDVKAYIDKALPSLLNSSQSYHYNGVIKTLMDSQKSTRSLFILALVFIYLILAAQFENLVDPFIILLTVPLCLFGALLTLFIFGQSINVYSQMGLLTLVGLVTKHGILLVEFANRERERGIAVLQAVKNSAKARLRPILMTSLTMIISALPLAMATGPGSLGFKNIGLALVGGLLVGTLFSLFVVPVAYVAMSNFRRNGVRSKKSKA